MRLVLVISAVSALLVATGLWWVNWNRDGLGGGLYARDWTPDPIAAYWAPQEFYTPPQSVIGTFSKAQCIQCHDGITPGIVADWRNSGHAKAPEPVGCPDCHGATHQELAMPSPDTCGGCHQHQRQQSATEARFGFPSHSLAMERAFNAAHFVDKPKAEVQACIQCHSVAQKCDSCHTRHLFDAAEARRPEACLTCHSGPPHPDDETFFASAHGQLYLTEGADWDWSKPLQKGNYKGPTCAYCHMRNGTHQVADKSLWKFGLKEINPHTSRNRVLRGRWVDLCTECHDPDSATKWLKELDSERKRTWSKLYAAERELKSLRSDDRLVPGVEQRPHLTNNLVDKLWPREKIGFYEGQAAAFYNVSEIERDYFEMWYFDNLGSYKAAAHGDVAGVHAGINRLDRSLQGIVDKAMDLRAIGEAEEKSGKPLNLPHELWNRGPYTDYNRDHN